jgi:uncharacterized protein
MIGSLLVLVIRLYQVTLGPLFGNCCRFYPSCSNYCIQAIRKHGCIVGLCLGAWRLLRCNPFNDGGVDFVPEPEALRARVRQALARVGQRWTGMRDGAGGRGGARKLTPAG